MGETTKIAWCDHTFNIAWGCFKVSPGCKNCYADTFSTTRMGFDVWGPPAVTERRTFGEKHWRQPVKWNREAEQAGERRRVFSSSMADVFEDHPTVIAQLEKLWPLIKATPGLDWMLLTKRAERIEWSLPSDWNDGAEYPNVWLGVSVEDHEYALARLGYLSQVSAAVRFVSYEPALGPIDWEAIHEANGGLNLDMIIYGGESGPGFRPEDKQWARDTLAYCRRRGIAFFHKQSAAPKTEMGIELDGRIVREFPTPRAYA